MLNDIVKMMNDSVKCIFTALWELSESTGVGLGSFAPVCFGLMTGTKPTRKKVDKK